MQQLGELLRSHSGRALCYGLIADEMRVEDPPSCGGQVSALPQVRDDHLVQVAHSGGKLQQLGPHAQHSAQLHSQTISGLHNQTRCRSTR